MSSLVDPGVLDPYEYASAVVRGYCGQDFTQVLNEVVLLDPRADGTAQLPQMPVTAVTAVAGWMPGSTGVWGWQPLTLFGWAKRGLVYNTALMNPPVTQSLPLDYPIPTWPWLPESLKVTYSHGFAVIPAGVQAIVTRIAAQIASNPAFVQSKKVGEITTVFGSFLAGITLRDTDKAIIDRYTVVEVA